MAELWIEKAEHLAKKLNHAFSDIKLLHAAITHRSSSETNNERLEFLGDSILNFVVAAELYARFPKAREGDLTRLRALLVRGETVAEVAREFGIGEYLSLGIGERKSGGHQRTSILADALEAIIGAIYLDSSLEVCRLCILRWYESRFNALVSGVSQKDAKTQLQEYMQARRVPLPEYQVVQMGGDAHSPIFEVQCIFTLLKGPFIGVANTRRKAEQNAADLALEALKKMRDNIDTVCGYAAIVGRPNVGKSTLLNHILGEKLSITSRKPQTTRHRLLGVKTLENAQIIYVDTPGMHIEEAHLLNKFMNKEARRALVDVDVIIFVIDSLKWNAEDQLVFDLVTRSKCPIILAVNKVDTLLEKTALLPYCEALALKFKFAEIIPISAIRTTNIDALERAVARYLPKSPHYFPEEQITDRTPRFRMAEIIREKLVRSLGEELPYSTTVEIEMYKSEQSTKVSVISAIIWVEREGQKPIVIGKNGERLKEIGIRSRKDIEKIVGRQVHLKLWVKVRGGWSDDERALKSLGYIDLE